MSINKIIIIGASGSIGSALAEKIKKENYEPILIGRNENDLQILSKKLDCEMFVCDVLDTDKISKIIGTLNDNIYGVAYCAGSINLKPLKLTNESDFLDSYRINTLGAINVIKQAQSSLIKNHGSILLFSTVAVKQGFVNHTVISTAKGALEGFTLALAAELSPNVRVNCIAPSLTDSKMSQNLVKNENIKKAIEAMHPIPKIGKGEDFANIGTFLLSKENKWITGQIIHIDGGRSTLRIKA